MENFISFAKIYDLRYRISLINPILASAGLLNLQNDLLTKLLHYENDVLSDDDNKAVLNATIKSIHKSTRFGPLTE